MVSYKALNTSPENATTAIFSCGAYPICFVSDAGRNNYCDYTDGTKDVVFGRKEVNGNFFITNRNKNKITIRIKRIGIFW